MLRLLKPLHVLLFVLAFQMEVRVRASSVEHSVKPSAATTLLSEPAECLSVITPCSFKVPSQAWVYTEGKMKISATPGSLLREEVPGQQWRIMDGALWIKNGPSITVKTASGDVDASNGEYWVIVENDRIFFRNISARLIITFKDKTQLEVPRGFQVWAAQIDSNARVQHGMVEPIRLKEHLKIWFQLYPGTKKEFLSEVQDLKDQWVDVTEQSGDIYQKVVTRKLAAIDEEAFRKEQVLKKRQQEKARLRQQFYNKVFQQ